VKPGLVALIDLVCVLVFAAIGRASHGEDLGPVGLATTTWPFAAGWLVGWVLVLLVRRARARPLGFAAGVLVWVPTVVVGMVLRVVSGAGVQTSFVVVATVVLGVFLLGWRGATTLVSRSRHGTRTRVGV
jgi:FtsH-binding integral membrane protein